MPIDRLHERADVDCIVDHRMNRNWMYCITSHHIAYMNSTKKKYNTCMRRARVTEAASRRRRTPCLQHADQYWYLHLPHTKPPHRPVPRTAASSGPARPVPAPPGSMPLGRGNKEKKGGGTGEPPPALEHPAAAHGRLPTHGWLRLHAPASRARSASPLVVAPPWPARAWGRRRLVPLEDVAARPHGRPASSLGENRKKKKKKRGEGGKHGRPGAPHPVGPKPPASDRRLRKAAPPTAASGARPPPRRP